MRARWGKQRDNMILNIKVCSIVRARSQVKAHSNLLWGYTKATSSKVRKKEKEYFNLSTVSDTKASTKMIREMVMEPYMVKKDH